MYRRRRPPRERTVFGFDSFLDVVANVIGIVVRLILVAWVGARSYSAAMQFVEVEPVPEPPAPQQVAEDPLSAELAQARRDLDEARARLHEHLKHQARARTAVEEKQAQLVLLTARQRTLDDEKRTLETQRTQHATQMERVALSLDELQQKSHALLVEVKSLQSQTAPKHQLRYHAPVSREVRTDEVMFECRGGHVTFVDVPAMLQEARLNMDEHGQALRNQWSVRHTTAAVGAFRLRYTVEREKGALEAATPGGLPGQGTFRYGISEWVLEPLAAQRGEPLATALLPASEFRQLVDRLDSRLATVTLWVYPDSFETCRQLRDYLYERGIEVACRPLPNLEAPIAASRHGTASRAQ